MEPAYDDARLDQLQHAARTHLWMHFAALPAGEVPVIVRGEGCYVWDQHGTRYLDGLAGLFTVQIGHGRRELAQAAADQMERLGYFPIWGRAHEPAIDLAARVASLAPGDLDRVFFTSGGSEANESAWKLARQYHRLRGEGSRYKVIARRTAYHGTTLGALSITGIPAIRAPFEPLVPSVTHVAHTNPYRHPLGKDDEAFSEWAASQIEDAIVAEGPETVAAVFLEPMQNSGGCIAPPPGYMQRVRAICDRYGVLMVSDEVICAWGRLGTWFGAQCYDYLPDLITTAKGLTSGYAPLGAVICRNHVAEPFLAADRSFQHGITFGGHPVSCAVALANLDVFERDDVLGNVARHAGGLRERMESLRELPIVGDVRGTGYFYAAELVRDQDTAERFPDEVQPALLAACTAGMVERGVVARADNRGDPVVQISPPLVAGDSELDELVDAVRGALESAAASFL
jgi:adenosylmethionine-8-amino-7-oxononanoate aminotransferase